MSHLYRRLLKSYRHHLWDCKHVCTAWHLSLPNWTWSVTAKPPKTTPPQDLWFTWDKVMFVPTPKQISFWPCISPPPSEVMSPLNEMNMGWTACYFVKWWTHHRSPTKWASWHQTCPLGAHCRTALAIVPHLPAPYFIFASDLGIF